MKAIELVRSMIHNGDLAAFGGLVQWTGDVTLRDYFGAVSHKGEMSCGEWFYVYLDDCDWYLPLPKIDPDVILQTEDAGDVYLWKIE